MKNLPRLLLPAALALSSALHGYLQAAAQGTSSPDATQAAMNLVLLSIDLVPSMAAQSTAQAWPKIEASLRTRAPQVDAATMAQLRSEFERSQVSLMSEMMVEAPSVYARHFTAEELDAIVAFYRTPAGAKLLKTMPQAMAEVQASVIRRLETMPEQINQTFDRILRQRGYIK